MTGICGWVQYAIPKADPSEVARKMECELPGAGDPHRSISQSAYIGGKFSSSHDLCSHANGLVVAIEGTPQFENARYRSIAQSDGNAKAVATAYEHEDVGLLDSVSGAFSLAMYDPLADRLVLAIDRMGIRSLCYAAVPRGLVFGSTTAAVLGHSDVDPSVSRQSIYDFFFFHVVPSPATIYSGISKLEPGQLIEFRNDTLRTDYYWTPKPGARAKSERRALERELIPCLRSAVDRCKPDADTGAFLSGGLDSSTVCGIANESAPAKLRAYTIGFAQEGYDEVEYAKVAANHFGLDLKTYYVTPSDVAESIEQIGGAYDEPFGNSSAIPTYFCAKIAKEDGVSLMLAGDGGDELFAGNERYATQKLFDVYSRVPSIIRRLLIEPVLMNVPMGWSMPSHKLKRYVEQARVPMPDRLQTYNYLQMYDPATIFERGFLDSIDVSHPLGVMRQWYERGGGDDLVDKMLFFDWKLTLADNDLKKVNTMCDLAGVDVAYPLLDADLVALSTRVRSQDKISGSQLRAYFKRSTQSLLPEETLHKGKHGFGLPFGEWLRSSEELRSVVAENIRRLKSRGIFCEQFIADVETRHRTDHAAFYGTVVWVLVLLEIWLNARDVRVN